MPNLPAPYVSPWREFARNLRSMAADLRLRLQEVWRRNREGDLSVPGFWPQGLAPWFWPVILVLMLGLVLLLPGRFTSSRAGTPPVVRPVQQSSEPPRAAAEASPAEPPLETVAEASCGAASGSLGELLLGLTPAAALVSARRSGAPAGAGAGRSPVSAASVRRQLAEDWQHRGGELDYEKLRLVDETVSSDAQPGLESA